MTNSEILAYQAEWLEFVHYLAELEARMQQAFADFWNES